MTSLDLPLPIWNSGFKMFKNYSFLSSLSSFPFHYFELLQPVYYEKTIKLDTL